jgi:16S rRNA processing protein RimM
LPAGRVGRPHGLDGSFHVTRPRAALLRDGAAVRAGERDVRIVRRAGTDERPIVRLEGIDSREAAEALRGADLLVPRAQAPALGENEFWAEELEGAEVYDGDELIGTVRELIGLPSCEALAVERPGGGELLVPMVSDAIRSVDVERRRIDVDLAFLGETAGAGESEDASDREG